MLLGGNMQTILNNITDNMLGLLSILGPTLEIVRAYLQAPLYTQVILLIVSLLFFAVLALLLYYVCLRLAGIFYTVYAYWYLPAFESILTRRMVAAKYSRDQIEAALGGRTVGRPVFRDKSRDIQGHVPTEDEIIFEEIAQLDAEIADIDNPNTELGRAVREQNELLKQINARKID
jgi:hypothetical protein